MASVAFLIVVPALDAGLALHRLGGGLTVTASAQTAAAARTEVVAAAATAFLDTLEPDQRRGVLFPFTPESTATVARFIRNGGPRMGEIKAGLDDSWFAWSGPAIHAPGQNGSAYYCIQGPKLVIPPPTTTTSARTVPPSRDRSRAGAVAA